MKKHLIETYINSPSAIPSPQGASLNSINITNLQANGHYSANNSPKRKQVKKYAASLQRIVLESPANAEKSLHVNIEGSFGIQPIENIKKRLNFKATENNFYNRSSSKHSLNYANEHFSSCNNSLISDNNAMRNSIKDNKFLIGNELNFKSPCNPISSKHYHSASVRYSTSPFKLKSEDYKERVSSLQENLIKLVDQDIWTQPINQQLQNYCIQTQHSIDKVYAAISAPPEIEQGILDSLFEKELCFVKLVKHIKSLYSGIISSNNFMNHQFKNMAEENKKLKILYQEEKIKEAESQDSSSAEIKSLLHNTLRKTERNERVWIIEKQQMAAQIEKLTHEIEILQDMTNLSNLKKQHESFQTSVLAKIRDLEKEIDEKDVKILKLENILARSTSSLRDLQKEHKDLTKKHQDLTEEHDFQKNDYQKCHDLQIMYREMAYMGREEFLQVRTRCDSLADSLSKTQKRYIEAQHQLDKLKREQSEMAIVNEEEFEKDSSLLNVIKQVFMTTKRQAVNLKLQNSQSVTSSNEPNNQENIQLEKYAFNKPTFYVFIQQEIEADMAESKQKTEEKSYSIDRQSLSMIRAILDSKYNELCYYEDYRLHSSFPDFVYSWLTTFYVCPQEKKIKATTNENIAEVQARRVNLYKFLLNPKMNKIWDVAVFREFLEEKCASDEIFFYLTCRYLIFEGAQLSYYASCLNPVHWVSFERVETLIDLIFKKMGQEDFNTLKYKLKERAKKKANKFYVDAGFVLRVLLEFYRNEKKLKIVMLQEALNKVSVYGKNNKPHVTYDIFKQFIEINYPFASELEKARLYREAWHIGNGRVDYESFFIAANESHFFTGSLRYFMFPKPCAPETYSVTKGDHELVQEMNRLIENKYKELLDTFEQGKGFARSLGIESLVSHITLVENNLTKNFNSIYDESKGQGIYILFCQLVQIFWKIRNQQFLLLKNTAFDENQLTKNDIEGFENIMKSINSYAFFDKIEQMEKTNKIRKFQIYFRNKKRGWLKVMKNALIKAKSKHNVA